MNKWKFLFCTLVKFGISKKNWLQSIINQTSIYEAINYKYLDSNSFQDNKIKIYLIKHCITGSRKTIQASPDPKRSPLRYCSSSAQWSWISCSSKLQISHVALVVKNLPANVGDLRDSSSIPGSGRSPGGGRGNPLQCSCLENPMDRGAWRATVHGVAKGQTLLSNWAHANLVTLFMVFRPSAKLIGYFSQKLYLPELSGSLLWFCTLQCVVVLQEFASVA